MNKAFWLIATTILLLGHPAAAQELRIGYIATFNQPVGDEQLRGFRLGLEHLGWKKNGDRIAGVPVRVSFCDDQLRPDVGLTCVRRLIQQEKIQIAAGFMWAHVLLASRQMVVSNKVILLGTNSGASPLAGEKCSRYFISTSWENYQSAEPTGLLLRNEKLRSIVLIAPNYQGGKDLLAGVKVGLQNPKAIKDQILFKLGSRDFQPELTRLRGLSPQAAVVFAPGPMGIAFMKQWAASGLGKSIKLYTLYTVDYLTLKPVGKSGVGTFHTSHWNSDSKSTANRRFVEGYIAKHGRHPSHFAAQAYDGALLIAAGIKGTGGKVDDTMALMKEMRKANYESVRGPYSYNVNGMPIQDFYKREVVLGADGTPTIRTTGVVVRSLKDRFWKKCPRKERLPN